MTNTRCTTSPKWDTYALSRFADVWRVLEINDGTFVASEGTLPAANVLEQHNDGPVADPPLHPMPFHANFDSPIYEDVRRCTSAQFRPKSVRKLADRIRTLANERLDELLPRGAFDLTQDYGGIVAASVVCELVGLPADLARRRAGHRQRRKPRATRRGRRGRQRPARLSVLPDPDHRAPPRRQVPTAACRSPTA